ncbi:hypothetical protein EIW28_18115 [Glycomyces terrestris]|uniref:Uncharacterized protein n=1 Tax=Glycomyces terrestris TaxID=2493553 RepID=A0A426UTR2_9ACTN|nr:hypothetical protein EIW28_18115 [Glycomyces terrestris]
MSRSSNGWWKSGSAVGPTTRNGARECCLSAEAAIRACEVPIPFGPVRTLCGMPLTAVEFMYRLERMCHSWPPACQSWRPLAYKAIASCSGGATPSAAHSTGISVSAVFSNWCSREVRMSLTSSAARCVSRPRNRSKTRTAFAFSPSLATSRS